MGPKVGDLPVGVNPDLGRRKFGPGQAANDRHRTADVALLDVDDRRRRAVA
jgi:hypothetical protein